MNCVVLVPFRGGTDQRRWQLWDWTSWWLDRILGWPIVVGDAGGETFSRAASVNAAAAAAGDWDVALIGDADTVQELEPAVYAAEQVALTDGACKPWQTRLKLSPQGTLKFAQRGPSAVGWNDRDRTDRTSAQQGGGTLMVSRSAWDAVGGMDPNFVGYGNEDLAFVAALETLVLGAPLEHTGGTCWHLHHRLARFVGTDRAATPANAQRWERYKAAAGDPTEMAKLIGASA